MAAPQNIHLSIPAASEFIVVARLSVSGIAARMNFSVEDIEDIKIALSEACTNAIQHAYEGQSGPSVIGMTFFLYSDKLEIEVKDTGKGFNPQTAVSHKVETDQPSEQFGLGLGLTFIKSLMDEANIQSDMGKGTVVKMVKYTSHTLPA